MKRLGTLLVALTVVVGVSACQSGDDSGDTARLRKRVAALEAKVDDLSSDVAAVQPDPMDEFAMSPSELEDLAQRACDGVNDLASDINSRAGC